MLFRSGQVPNILEEELTIEIPPKSLEDVVIVGYGTQKKLTNTGAQASMAGKLLVESPAANISNSLVGRNRR